jgi:hypothetical protein
MSPNPTTGELECAFVELIRITGGRSRPVVRITENKFTGTASYSTAISADARRAVYQFLARHTQFRLLNDEASIVVLLPHQAAEIVRIANEAVQIAAAME